VPKVRKVRLDLRDLKVQLGRKVHRVMLALKGRQALRGVLAHKALLDRRVRKET